MFLSEVPGRPNFAMPICPEHTTDLRQAEQPRRPLRRLIEGVIRALRLILLSCTCAPKISHMPKSEANIYSTLHDDFQSSNHVVNAATNFPISPIFKTFAIQNFVRIQHSPLSCFIFPHMAEVSPWHMQRKEPELKPHFLRPRGLPPGPAVGESARSAKSPSKVKVCSFPICPQPHRTAKLCTTVFMCICFQQEP